jgi:nucleoside-diphosphate-sugar epimerase
MHRILITGANGQIGSELVRVLRKQRGADAVVSLDLQPPTTNGHGPAGPHEQADVRDRAALDDVMARYDIGTVYHLASLLSATGEKNPDRTWDVNLGGLKNVLDLARERDLSVFWPSSIAVFGPSTPKEGTPQRTVLDPSTMYGVTKRSGELLCQYYHRRYGVDVRSLRYPGLISYETPPGGGTTDYAVEMFYAAAEGEPYTCFVRADTRLPMMYMPDAIRATCELMEADGDALTVRDSYNIGSMSFTAEALETCIQRHAPTFACSYAPDERQEIADAWPASVDDHVARDDWGWAPTYDLDAMTDDMLEHLSVGEREHGELGA